MLQIQLGLMELQFMHPLERVLRAGQFMNVPVSPTLKAAAQALLLGDYIMT
jgi:hypothetical protein